LTGVIYPDNRSLLRIISEIRPVERIVSEPEATLTMCTTGAKPCQRGVVNEPQAH